LPWYPVSYRQQGPFLFDDFSRTLANSLGNLHSSRRNLVDSVLTITAAASIQRFPPLVAVCATFEQFLLLFEGFFDAF